MNPRHPVYIISKGRWKNGLTCKALDSMGVKFLVIVEAAERKEYANELGSSRLLVLPEHYKENYDTFWHDGDARTGPGPARNFAWDHAINIGAEWHWVMDDNLDAFHRLNRNIKPEAKTGTPFRCMEDFASRYNNVAIAGPNYYSFCKATDAVPPFVLNTRIYSCLLIRNDIPYRWRGRYNEDTDLSLRALKDGWCTVQFNAFLQGKVTTQRMKGGNSLEFYDNEGTRNKSQMLADMHPDVARVVWKFNRWHHSVDYRRFKRNKLNPIEVAPRKVGVDNYGMILSQQEATT